MFPQTPRSSATRIKNRVHYDRALIFGILDEAQFCTVSYAKEGQPMSLPNGFCRIGDTVYLHGSVKSHFIQQISTGIPLCISVILLDALVLARSVFNHSMNYRSVVLFGKGRVVEDAEEKWEAMRVFTEKMIPGRWDDARQPNENEVKATAIIAIPIEEASAKVRTGPAGDDPKDMDLPVWAGLLPLAKGYTAPEANPDLEEGVEVPGYLES